MFHVWHWMHFLSFLAKLGWMTSAVCGAMGAGCLQVGVEWLPVLKEREPLPLLPFSSAVRQALTLRWVTVRNIWKLLAWVSSWILRLHTCIRKQKKNKPVASSVIVKRAWSFCLKWELVFWNLGCLVESSGWLQFVMLIVKSCGKFSKQVPLVLI